MWGGFVVSGAVNHDPVSASGNPSGAVAAHYYQGYWAGVQAAEYAAGYGAQFAGALAGAAVFGAFAPEAAAFEIIAIGAHIGAAIGQYLAGPPNLTVHQGGTANDNKPPFQPPGSPPPTGGGPPSDEPPSRAEIMAQALRTPDAIYPVSGMRYWMEALRPMRSDPEFSWDHGPPEVSYETMFNVWLSMAEANEIRSPKTGEILWLGSTNSPNFSVWGAESLADIAQGRPPSPGSTTRQWVNLGSSIGTTSVFEWGPLVPMDELEW